MLLLLLLLLLLLQLYLLSPQHLKHRATTISKESNFPGLHVTQCAGSVLCRLFSVENLRCRGGDVKWWSHNVTCKTHVTCKTRAFQLLRLLRPYFCHMR